MILIKISCSKVKDLVIKITSFFSYRTRNRMYHLDSIFKQAYLLSFSYSLTTLFCSIWKVMCKSQYAKDLGSFPLFYGT